MRGYLPDDEEMDKIEKENRVFSHDQLAQIAAWEKKCGDAGCDDDGHKCSDE